MRHALAMLTVMLHGDDDQNSPVAAPQNKTHLGVAQMNLQLVIERFQFLCILLVNTVSLCNMYSMERNR